MISKRPEILERLYWHKFPEWYTVKKVGDENVYAIKDEAPERVKKSFEEWLKHKDE